MVPAGERRAGRPLIAWPLTARDSAMNHRILRSTAILCLTLFSVRSTSAQTLRVQGDHFTVDGTPRFLLFVSYFDAMRRSNADGHNAGDIDTDLQYFHDHGYDGIRIFPNWWHYACTGNTAADDGLFTSGTTLRPGKWDVFVRVLNRAAAYGLLVDVSFTRETVHNLSVANYETQIALVTQKMAGAYPHVLFDLQNEFSNNGLAESDMSTIAAHYVRPYDSQRIITASTGGGNENKAGQIVAHAGLDVAAVHPARGRTTWYLDATIANAIRQAQSGMGTPHHPVYLQEPEPFSVFDGPGCASKEHDDTRGHVQRAVERAELRGAAAFTFHTRLTFDLARSPYVAKIANASLECATDECRELVAIQPAVVAGRHGRQVSPAPAGR
jgi:hypothetical protein